VDEDYPMPPPLALSIPLQSVSPAATSMSSSSNENPAKRIRQSNSVDEFDKTLIDILKVDKSMTEDQMFLMSLLPQFSKLPDEVKALAKIQIQMLLYQLSYSKVPHFFSPNNPHPTIHQHNLFDPGFSTFDYPPTGPN
jgi:hypothetical protein